jgi:antitoxin MazE
MLLQCLYRGKDDMRTVIKKWGNSASERIPAAVMQAARLDLDEAVDVREEPGRIVVEPAQRKKYDQAELVARITRENLHDEADFGKPVGKEGLSWPAPMCPPEQRSGSRSQSPPRRVNS